MVRLMLFVLAVALIASCGGTLNDNIQTKYTSRVRQLNLLPVYPPSEEIQVGDLFLNAENSGREERAAKAYITTIPGVLALAQAKLDSRVMFTTSKPVGNTEPTDASVGQQDDLFNGRIITRREAGREVVNSLPLTVFPEVTAYAGNDLSVGILAPLRALGLFAGSRTTVTLNFKDVRTYAAPQAEAEPFGRAEVCRRLPSEGFVSREVALVTAKADAQETDGLGPLAEPTAGAEKRNLYYRLITRVYLTRSITYTYRNARLLSIARKNLATPGTATGGQTFPANIVNVTVTPTTPTTATTTDVANAINDLKAQTASIGEGERFVSFNALGLTIERVFKQPVAVAIEGIQYDADRARLKCDELGVFATGVRLSAPADAPAVSPTIPSDQTRGGG
jgi:hypothetical protein